MDGRNVERDLLEDGRRSQHGATDLQHTLLNDEVIAPDIDEVSFHCTSHWPIVIQTTHTYNTKIQFL